MNPRERPGKRGMVFPPSWSGERFTAAEEEAQERLQEAEAERAPAEPCETCESEGMVLTGALDELAAALELKRGDELVMHERRCLEQVALGLSWRAERMREAVEA